MYRQSCSLVVNNYPFVRDTDLISSSKKNERKQQQQLIFRFSFPQKNGDISLSWQPLKGHYDTLIQLDLHFGIKRY